MKRSRALLILVGLMLIGAAVSCASGSDDSSPTLVPPVLPTSTPEPTATTTTSKPTATSETEIPGTGLRDPRPFSEVPTRPLPPGLDPGRVTERPSAELVIELWTKYLTNKILRDPSSTVAYHFCENGVMTTLTGIDSIFVEDTPGSWKVERNAAMSSATWWEVAFVAKKNDGIREFEGNIGTLGVSDGSASGEMPPVYESEYCKQVVNVGGR